MSIIGLDIASKTGLARWRVGDPAPVLSTIVLGGSAGDLARPMENLRLHLAQIHTEDPITDLFFEMPILPRATIDERGRARMMTSAQAVLKLSALVGMAEWFACRVKANPYSVDQQTWRKHFIGKGTGRSADLKSMAIEACRVLGWPTRNDNEADAAGVLDYGINWLGIHAPWRDTHLFGGAIAA